MNTRLLLWYQSLYFLDSTLLLQGLFSFSKCKFYAACRSRTFLGYNHGKTNIEILYVYCDLYSLFCFVCFIFRHKYGMKNPSAQPQDIVGDEGLSYASYSKKLVLTQNILFFSAVTKSQISFHISRMWIFSELHDVGCTKGE